LNCDLSALENESALAERISARRVTAESRALACHMADVRSSGMVEDVTGEEELVPGTRPGFAEIDHGLLRVMLEEGECRVGRGRLTEHSDHRYRCGGAHGEDANTGSPYSSINSCHRAPSPRNMPIVGTCCPSRLALL
jgi:hypothetical protein